MNPMNTILEQPKQQSITIRVVFDGAPYAGKTTAAYSLSEALGSDAVTPADDEGRTVWFDWLAYSGGRHEGKAIRVELVTVPGQEHLAARRRHLIEWGDAVVFIADTSAGAFEESVAKFSDLRSDLADFGELPVVVVANKRDLADALSLETVRERLALDATDALVEGIATSGGGIREAFIYAVRAALSNPTTRLESSTADELLAEMRAALTPSTLLAATEDHPVGDAAADDHDDFDADELEAAEEATPTLETDTDELEATNELDELETANQTDLEATNELDELETTNQTDLEATNELDELETTNETDLEATNELDELETANETDLEATNELDELETANETDLEATNELDELETAHETELEAADEVVSAVLHNARLNPTGIAAGGAVVILAEHWQMLVDIANGRTEVPLADGSEDADVASELVSWGLIEADSARTGVTS